MRIFPAHVLESLHPPLDGDPAGLGTWDTSKAGLSERTRTLETCTLLAAADLRPVAAVVGVPTDRASVWFMRIDGDTTTASPPKIEMEIRHGAGCAWEMAVHGMLAAPFWDSAGLIAQVAGRLVTQWELWGRIVPESDTREVKLSVRMIVDRVGPGGGCCGRGGPQPSQKPPVAIAPGESVLEIDTGRFFTADAVG